MPVLHARAGGFNDHTPLVAKDEVVLHVASRSLDGSGTDASDVD